MHAQNEKLKELVEKLSSENKKLYQSNQYLKRANAKLKESLTDFKAKVESLKSDFNISHNVATVLSKCASEVPAQLFESTAKRVCGANRIREYHPAIRKFALTLQLASSKAYRSKNLNLYIK